MGAFAVGPGAKLVHEQLALQWSLCAGPSRDQALAAGWFFLELMTKAMIEHLATTGRLGAPRRDRFSDQFHDDCLALVAKLTSDIVCRHREAPEVYELRKACKPKTFFPTDGNSQDSLLLQVVEKLNSALSFFLHDLLSIMDRGFVFSLIRTYMRDVGSRVANGSSESVPLGHLQVGCDYNRHHSHVVRTSEIPFSCPVS